MRVKRICVSMLMGVTLFCGSAYAQNISELESRIERLEEHMTEGNVFEGVIIGAGATVIIQGTSNANGASIGHKGNDRTDAAYSVGVELEKEFDGGAKAYMCFETGQGSGVTDDLEVFSNVNADADASGGILALTEVWYEQNFDDLFAITLGKINSRAYIDNNEYANDECSQFLADTFKNSPVIEFPDNTIGVRLGAPVREFMDVDIAILDGDGDFEQIGDHPFLGIQINIKPQLMDKKGNYRFVYWRNEAAHTKWDAAAKTKESSAGVGISFDQEVTDRLGCFLRAGWQSDEAALDTTTFSLESSYSAGVRLFGDLWNRDEDVVGIAYGMINPSDEYKKAGGLQAKAEGHFEIYYNYKINDNVSITPDLQMISNPYGKDAANGTSTIIIAGTRVQIDF